MAQATLGTIDVNKTEHAEAAQLATCAQVETWIEGGESSHITGPVKSYSLGKLSVDSGVETGKYGNQLAIRARNYLFQAGLLYRGVKMR